MTQRWLQAVAMAGLLGVTGLAAGCRREDRGRAAPTDQGTGGAGGDDGGPDIGDRPGVIRDGEGPIERMEQEERQQQQQGQP